MVHNADLGDHPAGERDPDRLTIAAANREHPVVVAATAAQTPAEVVEGKTRDQEHVDLVNGHDTARVHWLDHPPMVGLLWHVAVPEGEGSVILDPGQDPSPSRQPIEQLGDVHLVRHRQVSGNRAREPGGKPRKQSVDHLRAEG